MQSFWRDVPTTTNAELRQQIYHDLRKRIIYGELYSGQHLTETRIAEAYHINKAHVRGVLQDLQRDGLANFIPMKGFFVQGVSKESLLEYAKIREILETALFEDFLSNASSDDLETVKLFTERKIALLKAGLKSEAFKETQATFEKVYACTSYQHMVVILRQCQEYIDVMIRKAFDSPDDVAKTIQNSTLLYNVLNTRDLELAKEWIHIRYVNAVYKIERS